MTVTPDVTTMTKIIGASSGGNWQLANPIPLRVFSGSFEPGFFTDLLLKDLRLVLELAREQGLATPLLEQVLPLYERAKAAGKDITIVSMLCEGAFGAVMAGDGLKHDAIVGAALLKLQSEVDVIVLAQASMARVLTTMAPGALSVPVLSSPELAVQRMAKAMQARG